jgi:single-strand selective monofunctional uracil DNA glycosylase
MRRETLVYGDALDKIRVALSERVRSLTFAPPVACVYNPIDYARDPYLAYCEIYGKGRKHAIFVGMNPGPWGMAQTGIPFGDVGMVTGWLGIEGKVSSPPVTHPKRPVTGFQCPRGEVSGQRLWGWARSRFGRPDRFFKRFWVANYCPLVFMEESGRNRTPDKLKKNEKRLLFDACDEALRRTVDLLQPDYVIGIGNFAHRQAATALAQLDVRVGRISHPSPANPKANRGWADLIEGELSDMGLSL